MSGWFPPPPRIREAATRRRLFGELLDVLERLGSISIEHNRAVNLILDAKSRGARVFFIGNGASAAIASHMAADFLKNGVIAAQCFTDGALTTCLANDLGYENVFAKPLEIHGRNGDVLVAISSSGKSRSITLAAEMALNKGMRAITLSGFDPHNPLRALGTVNFYVPSDRYGVVEVAHHAVCHAILDAVIDAGKNSSRD